MKEKEQIFELSEDEKLELRLWCMNKCYSLPIQLYRWLLKSESHTDLCLRKICYLKRSSLGSVIDRYNWVISGTIPNNIIQDSDYPSLDYDPF